LSINLQPQKRSKEDNEKMKPITLQQISELSDKEKRQLHAWTNEYLGQQYAAQQRAKKIMTARMKLEFEESEDENELIPD